MIVETVVAKLKTLLRKAAECPFDGVSRRVGTLVDAFVPEESMRCMLHAGHVSN